MMQITKIGNQPVVARLLVVAAAPTTSQQKMNGLLRVFCPCIEPQNVQDSPELSLFNRGVPQEDLRGHNPPARLPPQPPKNIKKKKNVQKLFELKLQQQGLPKFERQNWLSAVKIGQVVEQKYRKYYFTYINGEYRPYDAEGYVRQGARGIVTQVLDNDIVEINFNIAETEVGKQLKEQKEQKYRQELMNFGIPSTSKATKRNASEGFEQARHFGGIYQVPMKDLEEKFDFLISGVDY